MTVRRISDNPASWIEELIAAFAASPENTLRNAAKDDAWDRPLIGFSRGDDPLYEKLKDDIGPFLWTPREIFTLTFPNIPIRAERLTVISWVLPQTETTKALHRKERSYPSEAWARSRVFGEEFNMKLARHVVENLKDEAVPSVAPVQSEHWAWQTSPKYGFAANWSERHAAYVSGLGTFGLSDGLITQSGKAMRCGSVVARIDIPPTPRPYDTHQSYCLFYSEGTCGKCIDRCPIKAISKEGHDKDRCKRYVMEVTPPYVKSQFGFEAYACGLCQTGIPCESKIPSVEGLD